MSIMQTQAPKTWEDVLRMPEDGNRYEFIGGRLYMTPAPATRHQRVLRRLWSALLRILMDSGHGEVFSAPLLVEFPGSDNRVQPDLFFVSSERQAIIGEIPVRLGRERLGLIDLDEVFSRHLDRWANGT